MALLPSCQGPAPQASQGRPTRLRRITVARGRDIGPSVPAPASPGALVAPTCLGCGLQTQRTVRHPTASMGSFGTVAGFCSCPRGNGVVIECSWQTRSKRALAHYLARVRQEALRLSVDLSVCRWGSQRARKRAPPLVFASGGSCGLAAPTPSMGVVGVQRVLPSALKPSVARPLRTRLPALSAVGACPPCAAAASAADRPRRPSATSPRPHPHRDHSGPLPSRCPRLPSATQGSGQHQHRSHTRTATATLRRRLPRPPQRRTHRHSPGLLSASAD